MSGSLSALISTACLMYFVNLSAVAIVMPYVCDRIGTVTRAGMRAIRLLINMRIITLVQRLTNFSMTAASCDQVPHHALAVAPIVVQWKRCCRCNISSSSRHTGPISAAKTVPNRPCSCWTHPASPCPHRERFFVKLLFTFFYECNCIHGQQRDRVIRLCPTLLGHFH